MRFPRSCGTLVHPTSFPSSYGMGDLGPAARNFLDFLQETGQTIWQVLPLTPVGKGNSPYHSWSAFAGNPYLLSPDILFEKGLLTESERNEAMMPVTTTADYGHSFKVKDRLFSLASGRFFEEEDASARDELENFLGENKYWLKDFTLFMVLLRIHGGKSWNLWEKDLAQRNPAALSDLQGH